MKPMPLLFLALAFLASFVVVQAQPKTFPDSIRVEIPDAGAIVVFELKRYTEDKQILRDFPAQLEQIANDIRKALPETEWSTPHRADIRVESKEGGQGTTKMSVTKTIKPVTVVKTDNNQITELIPPGWELTLRYDRAQLYVYAPDIATLEKLGETSFEPVIAKLNAEPAFEKSKRMGVITRLVMKDGVATTAGFADHQQSADMLGLHAGAGVGMVGDKFYPEFNFTTALYFANRYKEEHIRVAVGYELKLFSGRTEEGAFRSRPASFLTFSYGMNFARERPRWTAIGVGYMVHDRPTDLFTGKTMKLFIESDIGSSKLNLIPELYLTDDFKKSIFGLKLNYKF